MLSSHLRVYGSQVSGLLPSAQPYHCWPSLYRLPFMKALGGHIGSHRSYAAEAQSDGGGAHSSLLSGSTTCCDHFRKERLRTTISLPAISSTMLELRTPSLIFLNQLRKDRVGRE